MMRIYNSEAELMVLTAEIAEGQTREVDINWNVSHADCTNLGLRLTNQRRVAVAVTRIANRRLRIAVMTPSIGHTTNQRETLHRLDRELTLGRRGWK